MADQNGPTDSDSGAKGTPPINAHTRAGLALLWQAHAYAMDAGADLWDFALEISELYDVSLTISDLRWLVAKRFTEHGQETSFYGDPHRSFRAGQGLNFVPTTCFVLTDAGNEFVGRALKKPAATP